MPNQDYSTAGGGMASKFITIWIFASTVGFSLGAFIGDELDLVMVGIALGVGLAQAFVLSGQRTLARMWALASLALALGTFVPGLVAIIFVGIAQWFVLSKQLPRAGWWLLASTVAWLLGVGAGTWVEEQMTGPFTWAVGGAIGGLVYGIVAGSALAWLGLPRILNQEATARD